MIYDCHPKKENNKAQWALLSLFLLSGASFAISGVTPLPPVAMQIVGLLFLLPGIQLLSRSLVSHYLYRLREREGGRVDLEVYVFRGGKRMQLVCRIGLSEIVGIAPLDRKKNGVAKGCKRYIYVPDLWPDHGTVLSVSNGDGECEVLIYPDERMLQMLGRGASTPTQE